MTVQKVQVQENKIRYLLLDDDEAVIMPVAQYLKYLDNLDKKQNTIYTYCHSLKNFFTFLKQIGKNFDEVTMYELSKFVAWLRNPYADTNIIVLDDTEPANKPKRAGVTVNLNITAVVGFYDFCYRHKLSNNIIINDLMQYINGFSPKYKEYLSYVNYNKKQRNTLAAKTPRKKVRVLQKETVHEAYKACTNLRDKLLIRLLYETGFRISEALSLHVSDFIFDHQNGHKIRLVDRDDLPERLSLKSGERSVLVSQTLLDLFDDYVYEVLDDMNLNSQFVFVKLEGKNKGDVLENSNIESLFSRLSLKIGTHIHPHLLRHTHATLYYKATNNLKALQERLGHAQIQTTIDMYIHLSEEDIREDWERAQPAFGLDINNWIPKEKE